MCLVVLLDRKYPNLDGLKAKVWVSSDKLPTNIFLFSQFSLYHAGFS